MSRATERRSAFEAGRVSTDGPFGGPLRGRSVLHLGEPPPHPPLMIASGASIKAVQRQLGHASAAMTLDLYGHLYDDDLEALADALDQGYAAARAAHTRPKSPGEVVSIDPETRRNP